MLKLEAISFLLINQIVCKYIILSYLLLEFARKQDCYTLTTWTVQTNNQTASSQEMVQN